MLLLLLIGSSVLNVLGAPDVSAAALGKRAYQSIASTSTFTSTFPASSSSSVPSTSFLFHNGRQCEWSENGQRCTQTTQAIDVALCAVHREYISVVLSM